jgi:hypothetical protein
LKQLNGENIMSELIRTKVIETLEGDWASIIERYNSLSTDIKSEYLVKQGYARFADLLAHIIAWWEEGCKKIDRYLLDPEYQSSNIDINEFNANAVEKVKELPEDYVIKDFELRRIKVIIYIKNLPEIAFTNEKVIKQLEMEFIGHLNEHNIGET